MKKNVQQALYLDGLAQLVAEGFDPEQDLLPVQEILEAGKDLPQDYRDHALLAPLTGYRACHLGAFKGRTVVLVYRDTGRRISWEALGEHDAAYQAIREKA